MTWFRRRDDGVDSKAERRRADRLDDALAAWQRNDHGDEILNIDGDPDLAQPLGDELAAAQRLAAFADATPSPHEPLVALRAALAAKSDPLPIWRRVLTSNRLAPVVAAAAVIAAIVVVGPQLTGPRSEQLRATDVASRSLREARDTISALQGKVKPGANPVEISAALKQAQDALIAAQAVASLAQGDVRARLLAEVGRQRREIDALRGQVNQLTQPVVGIVQGATTTTAAPGSTTTSLVPTTSTTAAPTTTTTHPSTTSTTRLAPTTTTTPKKTTTTSSTTPPPPQGDFGTGSF